MKIKILVDEQWPTFFLDDEQGTEVDVHANTVQRWKRIQAEYNHMQFEMKAIERGHDQ